MKIRVIVAVASVALCSHSAVAQQVYGSGNVICSETEEADYVSGNAVGDYILGHVSGALYSVPGSVAKASTWSAQGILDKAYYYCAANQTKHVHDAATHVVADILN